MQTGKAHRPEFRAFLDKTCMYLYIYIYVSLCVCACVCVYVCLYIYIYVYIYICMYIYIYMYIGIQSLGVKGCQRFVQKVHRPKPALQEQLAIQAC